MSGCACSMSECQNKTYKGLGLSTNPLICSSNNITCSKLFKEFDWWFHDIFGSVATSPDLHQLCVGMEVFPSLTAEVQFEKIKL